MNKDTITSKQLIFIIIGAQIGIGILSLPRVVSAEAHQDAWIAIILGALFPFLILFIIERLGRQMPEFSFVRMNHLLFGRWLGSGMIILFIVYILFFQSVTLRLFAEITNVFMLPRTPLPVIILMIILGVVYVINKGARVIGRVNELIFWIILPLLFLVMVPLTNADYTNLLPMGEVGLTGIARGTLSSSFSYAGIEVLLVFYFLVSRKGEVIKAGILGLAWTTMVYLILTLVAIMVWGSETIQMINWPVLTLLKTIKLSVLERPELFMLAIWMGVSIRPFINMGFSAAYSLSELLHVERDKYFIWWYFLLLYLFIFWPCCPAI